MNGRVMKYGKMYSKQCFCTVGVKAGTKVMFKVSNMKRKAEAIVAKLVTSLLVCVCM